MSEVNDPMKVFEKKLSDYHKRMGEIKLEKSKPPQLIVTFDANGETNFKFEGYIDHRMITALRTNLSVALNSHWESLKTPDEPTKPQLPTATEEPKKPAVVNGEGK